MRVYMKRILILITVCLLLNSFCHAQDEKNYSLNKSNDYNTTKTTEIKQGNTEDSSTGGASAVEKFEYKPCEGDGKVKACKIDDLQEKNTTK